MSFLKDDPFHLTGSKKQRDKVHHSLSQRGLTKQLKERLSSGQFRYINEQLYTVSGREAQSSFAKDPSLFSIVSLFFL